MTSTYSQPKQKQFNHSRQIELTTQASTAQHLKHILAMFTVTQCMSSWSLYTHRLVSVMYLWPAPDKYSHTLTRLTNYKFNWLVINLLLSDQSDTSITVPYYKDHIGQGSDLSSCLIYPNPCHNNLKQESTLRAAFLAHPLTFLPPLLYYGQFITDFLEHSPNLFQSLHMHRLLLLLLLLYSDLFTHSSLPIANFLAQPHRNTRHRNL